MLDKVEEIRHDDTRSNNRLGVLLGNAKCAQTKTLTHVLWSLLNSIAPHSVQRPHRHNSTALDLCVSIGGKSTSQSTDVNSKGKIYTLMGREIDANGLIIDPIRCDWVPGGCFVTPPGWWHSHHNESDEEAWVLPIQDAGLFTHQRTLDIRFVDDELALHHSGRIRGSAFVVSDKQFTEMKRLSNNNCDNSTTTSTNITTTETSCDATMVDNLPPFLPPMRGIKRAASIQVGALARETEGVNGNTKRPITPLHAESAPVTKHERRKSIQVGADLKFLRSSIVEE